MNLIAKLTEAQIIELCSKHLREQGYEIIGQPSIQVDTMPGESLEDATNIVTYEAEVKIVKAIENKEKEQSGLGSADHEIVLPRGTSSNFPPPPSKVN